MARALIRSGTTVPELWDREIFLKEISDSKYELWVGTLSGEATKVSSGSDVAGVEGLQALIDALNSDLVSQLNALNGIIQDLYGSGGEPGGGIPTNEAFVAVDTFNTLASQVSALISTVGTLSGTVDLKAFLDDLTDLSSSINGSISALQIQIDAANAQIALRALSVTVEDYVDDLGSLVSRVTAAETLISQNASDILLRATKVELETVTDTVGDVETRLTVAEASISVNADQILLRATKDELETVESLIDGLSTRLTSAETSISLTSDEILLLATKVELETLEDSVGDISTRLTSAESAISLSADEIALRATKLELETVETSVGDLLTRMTEAESSITLNAGQIALKASQSDMTQVLTDLGDLDTRVTASEASILIQADEIASRVSTSTFTNFINGDFGDALARITAAETSITQKADSITLSNLQTAFDALGNTVGENTAEIQVLSTRISSQVTGTIIGNVSGNLSGTRTSIPVKAGIPVRLLDGDLIKIVSASTGVSTTYTVDSNDPVAIGATSIPIVSATVTASDNDVVVIDGIQILSRIDQFGNQITSMVTQTYVDGQIDLLQTQIQQTESNILLQASSLSGGNKIATTGNTTGTTVSLSSALLIDLKSGDVVSIVTQPSNAVVVRTVAADANAGATSFSVTSAVASNTGGGIYLIKAGGKSLISQINVTPEAVSILSEKINLSGFVTFSGFADAFNTNVTTIDGGKIATGSITANKLAAGVIEAGSIAAGSITADKIASGAVTIGKIADGAITAAKIASGEINATHIEDGTITTAKIAANTITAANIAAGTITAAQIAAGAVTAEKLTVSGEFFVNAINAYDGIIKIAANKVALSGSLSVEGDVVVSAINSAGTTTKISWNKIQTSAIESNNWGASEGSRFNLETGSLTMGGSVSPKFAVSAEGNVTIKDATIQMAGNNPAATGTLWISVINGPMVYTNWSSADSQWFDTGFTLSHSLGLVAAGAQVKDLRTPGVWSTRESGVNKLRFFDVSSPIARPTVTGSKGGNAALDSLVTALANLGLITNSTS